MISFSKSPAEIPPVRDIYYHALYGRSAQQIDSGHWECAFDDSSNISYSYIRREVDRSHGYYDTITPYGYGGLSVPEGVETETVCGFRQTYLQVARERGLVAELARLNPLDDNQHFLRTATWTRRHTTYGSHVEDVEEEFQKVSGKHRTANRRGLALGVTIHEEPITSTVDPAHPFRKIYDETMSRVQARDALRLDDTYFGALSELPSGSVRLLLASVKDTVIAGSIFLVWQDRIHYHLSCASAVGRQSYATNTIIEFAKRNLLPPPFTIHLGGGLRGSDSLAKFKSRCTSTSFDMPITATIVDQETYSRLSAPYPEQNYFPAYRKQ